jgi:hypothetical protein
VTRFCGCSGLKLEESEFEEAEGEERPSKVVDEAERVR